MINTFRNPSALISINNIIFDYWPKTVPVNSLRAQKTFGSVVIEKLIIILKVVIKLLTEIYSPVQSILSFRAGLYFLFALS